MKMTHRIILAIGALPVLWLIALPAYSASEQACERLRSQFFDQFECCGAGAGHNRCLAKQNAYSRAGCGVLTCFTGDTLVYETFESFAGEDINGDGDTDDIAWLVEDLDSGQRVSFHPTGSGTSTGAFLIDGSIVALNTNDGGPLRYFDIAAQELVEVPGYRDPATGLSNGRIVFCATEFHRNEDLNGDGQISPGTVVAHLLDVATGQIINTGVEATGGWASISGDIVAVVSEERTPGVGDLTGDGDTDDSVIRYHNLSTQTTVNTMVVATGSVSIDLDIIAFRKPDTGTVAYYDISSEATTDTGIPGNVSTFSSAISGNIILLTANEVLLGQDLNGDSQLSGVLAYHDISTGDTVGFAGGTGSPNPHAIDDGLILYDLLGGGDLWIYEVATGQAYSLGRNAGNASADIQAAE